MKKQPVKQTAKEGIKEVAGRLNKAKLPKRKLIILDVGHLDVVAKLYVLTLPELKLFDRMLIGAKEMPIKLPEEFVTKLSGLGLLVEADNALGWRSLKTRLNEISTDEVHILQDLMNRKINELARSTINLEKFGKDTYIERYGEDHHYRMFVPTKLKKINELIRKTLYQMANRNIDVV